MPDAQARVARHGDVVHRPMGPWSPSVHQLLEHLKRIDFPAPRIIGVDGDTEILSFIEGESGPDGWAQIVPEQGLRNWARFLRRYHDAVAEYQPSADSVWSSGTGTCAPGEVMCHGDVGPWNGVWRDGEVVALIDWDHARPASPMYDVAYALEYAAPFRPDLECTTYLAHPEPPDRSRRIANFCDAYGIAVPDDVCDFVAEQQRFGLELVRDLAQRGTEPQASWVASGYLDELRARIDWTEAFRVHLQ